MSCIVEKFSHFIELTAEERETLKHLEKEECTYRKREVIFSQDRSVENLYVIKEGLAISYCEHSDGGRIVLNFHFPGDLVNAMTLGLGETPYSLMAVSDSVLCPFPKSGFSELFSQSARLTSLIYAFGMLDNTVLIDRLRAIGRMSAENRLALLILQIHARLNLFSDHETLEFDAPISQEIMADAVGLTPVYVNRILSNFREQGLLSFRSRRVVIHDKPALLKMSEFKDRYYNLDISWLPSEHASTQDSIDRTAN